MEKDSIMQVIESLAKKKKRILTREEFKMLKRGRKEFLERVDQTEGKAIRFTKWYDDWKEKISMPLAASHSLSEVFK